ncbi:hypothetical protein NFI96_021044, partial [Prochilodus magdalenae]
STDSSSFLSEDQFLCCICLDVFTDPVSTPCGHNFCMKCIGTCWGDSEQCQCPFCKETFTKRPELKINTTLREVVDLFKKKSGPEKPEVLCDVCTGVKQEALKSCLDCGVTFCKSHLEPHNTVPKLKKHKLINPVKNLENYICQKHERPLELFCRDDQTSVCQLCTVTDHKTHSTVPIEEESGEKKTQLDKTQAEVQQMIQDRLKKIKDIKHSVELRKRNTEKEKADSVELFTALIRSIERSQAELLEVMEEKQKAAERQAEDFIKDLEQEITELQRRDTELEQISHTVDHLQILQVYPSLCRPPHTNNWTDTSIDPHLSVETVKNALSQLQKSLNEDLTRTLNEKIRESVSTELKRIQQQYSVDVTLDADTAHPKLILSDDGKQVAHGDTEQNLPDTPKRFTYYCMILGKEGFSSGRFYYEVQVRGKTEWDIGVARGSINRKGEVTLKPQDGFWTVWLRNGTEYRALAGPAVHLSLREKPQKVGVFVDYEEGLVSFYDVEARSHIYSFTGQSFTEKLYPYFNPCPNDRVSTESSSFLSEGQFLCSICLDVFTDPVSTPCGHNFCMKCIGTCWGDSEQCQCPFCKETFTKRPELKINTTLREVVDLFKKKSGPEKPEVLCDACTGVKQEALKSCLDCGVTFCKSHLEPHYNVPRYKKHKLINPVKNLENYICQKHERPLELFCRDDQTSVCLFCTETDHKTHSTVPIEEESGEKKTQLDKTQAEVQQMIQDRLKKIKDIKHSVQLRKRNTEKEKADSVEVFTALIRSIERSQAELLEVMEEKQKAAERQAEDLIKELEQEITKLQRRDTELEQISHTEDHLHLLQVYPSLCRPPHTMNWTDTSIDPHLSVDTVRNALSQLQKSLNEKIRESGETVSTELKRIQQQYSVDVTLDADTAQPELVLSADGKQVTCGDTKQNLPNTPKRFDRCLCVLGKEGFSSGRFYYEVQVRGKTEWDLGVVRESINRKGKITLTSQDGFWTVILRNENKYQACDCPAVLQSMREKLQKVGVFVDYEEGLVSFYNVEARSHIYSFTGQSFTEKLYPYFSPGLNDGDALTADDQFLWTQLEKTQTEVQQMIQDRLKKIKDIKHSVELRKRNTEKEKADSVEVFTALIRSIERSQAELLEVMEEKQKAAERQAEDLIKELEQEITKLQRRDTELEQISHTEDHLHLLQVYPSLCRPPHTKDWTDTSIDPHLSVETVRNALSQLQKSLNEDLTRTLNEKIRESVSTELKRIQQQYSVDVTLDADTANLHLILSDDGKRVTCGDTKQNLPDTPKRFTYYCIILGKEGFSSGRFYYEVQVSGKTEWDLGVARESINRKGEVTLKPQDGFWTVWLRNGNEYRACAGPPVLLSLREKLQKVGVFVDYEEGLVSFYNVEARSHIYSFTVVLVVNQLVSVINSQSFLFSFHSFTVSPRSSDLLSEDQFLCCICLDVFTDPVSTPCGHNFCMKCIGTCWGDSEQCQCPFCKETFTKRPELKINTTLREVVDLFKKKSGPEKPELLCDACTGVKQEALKSCLDCGVTFCKSHLEPHNTVPKLKKHKLINPVKNLENYICQKHERPLELFCRDDQTSVCQLCTVTDHKTHSTVPIEEESGEKKTQLDKTQTEVQQMIQGRLKKIKDIKHSVQLRKRNTEKEKADSVGVFTALIRSIERSQAELLEVMEEKQKAAERQAEDFIKELEQEITELQRRDTELEQISHTVDHLQILQVYPSLCRPPHTKNWTDTSIDPHLSVETVKNALSQLQKSLNEDLTKALNEKIRESVSTELKRIQQQYSVDVTLDADTAHSHLILSDDGKQVTCGDTKQNLPDTPKRFTYYCMILGKEGFSSGRFYYEVQVTGKTRWDLGVARGSINRKGEVILSPQIGFWTVGLRNGNEYRACAGPSVLLSLREKPQKVGVFVDYEEGLVSFYNVEVRALIYSFTVAPDSSDLLSEGQFLCSICLDVFTDPVSTPCGHNFCMKCIGTCWGDSEQCHCPFCKETFTMRPELKINAKLREVVDLFKTKSGPEKPELLCDVCTGMKQEALKSCLDCGVTFCKSHLEPHNTVPKLKKHKLITPVKNLENYICQKHERPLELFCRDDGMCVCQFCTVIDHRTHCTVPIEAQLEKTQTEVQQMIQDRLKKIKDIKHSVELRKRNTEKEKADSVELFTALIRSIERSQAELLEVMEEKQKAAERQAEDLIKELEQEITELQRRDTELEQISQTEDHLHLLQIYPSLCRPPHTKNWTDISIDPHLSVETVRNALSQLQKSLNEKIRESVSTELKRIQQQYSVDVTLDADTANLHLILSDDGKRVTCGDTKQNLPDTPKRFDMYPIVLGKEGFSSGRFYYEVQVSRKTKWTLGVARESISRKGGIILKPQIGFWTVGLRNGNKYEAHAGPSVNLSLREKLQKVGVFVDYEEGLVSFYNVDARSHIYSFTGQSFTEKLYLYFCPCLNDGDLNKTGKLFRATETATPHTGKWRTVVFIPELETWGRIIALCDQKNLREFYIFRCFTSTVARDSEDQFLCPICLDMFTDPVTTPCGHNFCKTCLKQHWNSTTHCQCPVCKESFTRRPELKINTAFREVVMGFKKKNVLDKPQILCDYCTEVKQKALKSCLDCVVTFCKSHLEPHYNVPRLKKHKLIKPVKNLEDYICQKHERPLELFCRDDQTCVCQFCTEGDHKTHSTVPIEEESEKKKAQLEKTQTEVQQMIQDRLKKIKEIEHSVELRKKNTEKDKIDSVEVFTALMCCIERSLVELLKVLEEKQKAAERQAEDLINKLEQEITELKRRDSKLEQISHTEDHLHLLQVYPSLCRPPHTKDWTDISIDPHLSINTLKNAVSQLQQRLEETIRESELKRIQQYAVDVTLDADTAHRNLILSDDGKQVTHGKTKKLPQNPKRFDVCTSVLGKEGFSSRRFYYEVQVREKTEWELGVVREFINRKGKVTLNPQNGFWTVILRKGNEYSACAGPSVLLPLKEKVQKVGVFVDYEEGLVSFYDVEARSHIYSFTGQSFTEKLYPYFNPCNNDGGKNSALLTITPVSGTR